MTARPAGVLLDLGDTLFVEESYDLVGGIEGALLADPVSWPRARAAEAARDLAASIERVHRTNRAEFRMRDWVVANVDADDPEPVELSLWKRIPSLSPMPDADRALDFLAEEGIAVAVISNAIFGSHVLKFALEQHGLGKGCQFVISSADLGVRKPDPAIFEEGIARIGLPASDCWYVGDSFVNDVEGAHRVGMTPVWFNRSDASAPDEAVPHLRVGGWREFVELCRGAQP